MLDADEARLTKIGKVTVTKAGEVRVAGFEGDGTTCRDVCALAMVHAIGVLQRELTELLQKPGGGNVCVD